MRFFVLAALVAFFSPAFAADQSALHAGDILRDSHNKRLGRIEDVLSDGTVGVIIDDQYIHVPISTIKIVDGKPVTSMTKDQLSTQ
jgi:hypothetical protein